MFKAIISHEGAPYPLTGLTTQRWIDEVPLETVVISDLIAMQDGVKFAYLNLEPSKYRKDPFPHVVRFNTLLYLEDGHHRVVTHALYGERIVVARVLDLDAKV